MAIEFKAEENPAIVLTLDGKVMITLITRDRSVLQIQDNKLKDKPLSIKIANFMQKRSLSQNAYLWYLLEQIAQKIKSSKEDIYKQFIKDYGVFEILPIRKDAAERFKTNWSKNGLGWFTEDLGESKLSGYVRLIVFYGSSVYNRKEMCRVLDQVIQECNNLGINTMSLADIMLLQNDNE